MFVTKQSISEAKDKIRAMILEQAEFGCQTKEVQKVKQLYFSIGQFLGDPTRVQRGIHGSSNALTVLADTDKNNVINGIVRYLEKRVAIEKQLAGSTSGLIEEKLLKDEKNTIKLSEILYALGTVKPAQASTENFVGNLENRLYASQRRKGNLIGWRYFTDDPSDELQLLPTAYAVLALNRNGFKTPQAVEYLRSYLNGSAISNPTELAEIVFTLYALIKGADDYKNHKSIYDNILGKIWKSQYCTLTDNYEQNIEYWFGAHHEYIRIPWQLFLLSITSKISVFKFYSLKAQSILSSIIETAKQSNFKYPYSGHYISTRTNAILYDVLTDIDNNISNDLAYQALYYTSVVIDKIREFFGSAIVRYFLSAVGLIMAFLSIKEWYIDKDSSFKDFASEFIGWIAIGLILLGKKK
jgi:hypothetical protein